MRLTLAFAIVVAAFAGCGGDGDDTAGSPPPKSTTAAQGTTTSPTKTTTGDADGGSRGQQRNPPKDPRTTVEAVLTSSDPADACGRFVTEHYLRVAYGDRQGCVGAQAPGSAADQLDLRDFRINRDRATAVVVPSGGPYDGERLTVSLVTDGRRWAVDELEANVPVGP